MNYFIDTEFIEGFHKPLFGKRRHYIDLISIGIVAEDGREYYAISNEYSEKDADEWVRKNVIHPLFMQACDYPGGIVEFEKQFIKSKAQIAQDILHLVYPPAQGTSLTYQEFIDKNYKPPVFYGYYADYDWVLFCSLFGRMIDLPKSFPMYCRDIKQMLDEKVDKMSAPLMGCIPGASFDDKFNKVKSYAHYPKQVNEHNALSDAKWNKALFKFIKEAL